MFNTPIDKKVVHQKITEMKLPSVGRGSIREQNRKGGGRELRLGPGRRKHDRGDPLLLRPGQDPGHPVTC